MGRQTVFVEVDLDTELPIRILKTNKQAYELPPEKVRMMARSVAVKYIRDQVVERARKDKNILCEFCGLIITEDTGHMHEVLSRGKGGEVSLENSRFICAQCHLGPDGEHGDRRWQKGNIV